MLTEDGRHRVSGVHVEVASIGAELVRRETEERQECDEGDNDQIHRLHLPCLVQFTRPTGSYLGLAYYVNRTVGLPRRDQRAIQFG